MRGLFLARRLQRMAFWPEPTSANGDSLVERLRCVPPFPRPVSSAFRLTLGSPLFPKPTHPYQSQLSISMDQEGGLDYWLSTLTNVFTGQRVLFAEGVGLPRQLGR